MEKHPVEYNTRPTSIAVGDFNSDTGLDVVVTRLESNTIIVLLGFGDGIFWDATTYSTGSRPIFVAVADFNEDNRLDIAVANYWSDNVCVFLGYVDSALVSGIDLTTGNASGQRSLVVADFNNDTHVDIAISHSGSESISIFLGYGNISFTDQMTCSTGSSSLPYSIAAGDLNNDSRADLVVANYGTDNVGVFLGYGSGSFMNQSVLSTGFGNRPYSVAVADFNNDSLLDILVANHGTNNIGIFLGYGNGLFADQMMVAIEYGSLPFSVVVRDFNNDQLLDMAVENSGTDNVNILLQTC